MAQARTMTTTTSTITRLTAGPAGCTATPEPSRRASRIHVGGPRRLLLIAGAVLIVSGLAHLGVFLVDGGAWAGPVSWRKPVVFGLSLGLLSVTLAWILDAFSLRPATTWAVAVSVSAGSLVETFLISLQRWRGVASHFNEASAFDVAVWASMGVAISFVFVPTVILAARSTRPLRARPSQALAIRGGLALLFVGQAVVGGVMMAAGAQGADAFKVPHALALHGLQVLLLADWLLGRAGLGHDRRTRGVAAAAITLVALVGATLARAWASA